MREDMIVRGDRSIRNIPISSGHRRPPVLREPEEEYGEVPPARGVRRPRGRRWFVWALFITVILCAILGILLSTLFAGAVVTVYTREADAAAPASITAALNPPQGGLAYVSMSVTRAGTTTAPATGTRDVSRPASGVITIYNAYSTEEQRLITNTRFEAPDGKIYRIHEPITVPGATRSEGGSLTPGTISVTVYADSPGESYNRGETRFTIPGFRNDPRYSTFYAEGDAITGGFVGTEPAIAEADRRNAEAMLRQGLESAINSAITSQMPEGFVPVAGAFDITFSDIAQLPASGNTATLSQSATAIAAIVRISDLAASIARSGISGYEGEAVTVENIEDITVSVASTTKPVGELSIQVRGATPNIVWQYDPIALKQALLGKEKSAFESILESFRPAVVRAEAKVRPFWQSSFPNNPEKITVETAEAAE